jgi:acyl-CoA reductase-like NAD-dependent aldehyde dehydrogenase
MQPLAERVAIVEKFAALLEENKKHLAEVISQETSKPLQAHHADDDVKMLHHRPFQLSFRLYAGGKHESKSQPCQSLIELQLTFTTCRACSDC